MQTIPIKIVTDLVSVEIEAVRVTPASGNPFWMDPLALIQQKLMKYVVESGVNAIKTLTLRKCRSCGKIVIEGNIPDKMYYDGNESSWTTCGRCESWRDNQYDQKLQQVLVPIYDSVQKHNEKILKIRDNIITLFSEWKMTATEVEDFETTCFRNRFGVDQYSLPKLNVSITDFRQYCRMNIPGFDCKLNMQTEEFIITKVTWDTVKLGNVDSVGIVHKEVYRSDLELVDLAEVKKIVSSFNK